jgi:hypothetical protein
VSRFREHRFRETHLWGIKLGVVIYPPSILQERGFKLIFYSTGGLKVGELGSDVKEAHVSEAQFELADFGCGAFSFKLDEKPAFSIGDRTRVSIHPYFDTQPWFIGFIQKQPDPGAKKPFEYSGFGFYEQLDWILVTESYTTQDISDIVKDIINTIVAPNTQIVYNAAKVETVGYMLNSISFDHTKAKDAIQMLADAAQNFEFGVDNEREFYFRAIDTSIKKYFWAGKHFQDDDIQVDPTGIRNKLYVKVGQIQAGGTNIIGSVSDSGSISTYGMREDVITAPEILSTADALRWAGYILDQKKNPMTQAKVGGYFLDTEKEKISALGKVKLTTEDGDEYSLAVKRVTYKISAAGMTADLELGTIIVPFEQQLVNMLRQVQEEQRLGDQRTKQLYT